MSFQFSRTGQDNFDSPHYSTSHYLFFMLLARLQRPKKVWKEDKGNQRKSRLQYSLNQLEYLEESWWLDETCCRLLFHENTPKQ